MNLTDDLIINNILFNKYNTLSKLCNHAQNLMLLDKVLKSHLSADIAAHCRIGNIKDNFIVIETDRSEYLTQLKFNSIELLSSLRKHPAFMHIATIKYKVCPEFNHAKTSNTRKTEAIATELELSQEAIESFSAAIKDISDPELKQALMKIINNDTAK